jgi:hypothetical protein
MALLLVGCVLAIPAVLFVRQGRFCAVGIGAIGHPYFQYVDGKAYLVACGERTLEGTYRRTASGWETISVSRKGATNTSPLEFHWWGVVMGEPPMSFPRCWHFWMNSRGPLWNPWD